MFPPPSSVTPLVGWSHARPSPQRGLLRTGVDQVIVVVVTFTFHSLLGSGATVALHGGPDLQLQDTLVSV